MVIGISHSTVRGILVVGIFTMTAGLGTVAAYAEAPISVHQTVAGSASPSMMFQDDNGWQ